MESVSVLVIEEMLRVCSKSLWPRETRDRFLKQNHNPWYDEWYESWMNIELR